MGHEVSYLLLVKKMFKFAGLRKYSNFTLGDVGHGVEMSCGT